MTDTAPSPGLGTRNHAATSWWRRYLHTLWEPPPPLVVQDGPTSPIAVPCRDHVFDFHVSGYFTWRASDLREDRVNYWIRYFTPAARMRLHRQAVELARRFRPQEGHLFNEELNAQLKGVVWPFTRQQAKLTCQVWCSVALDEEVRATLQPMHKESIAMQEQHQLDLRRAALAHRLTEEWSGIFDKLQADPLAEAAASLSDREFADAFTKWWEERRKETTSLLKLLGDTSRISRTAKGYEFAEVFDAAVRAFRREHGIPETEHP